MPLRCPVLLSSHPSTTLPNTLSKRFSPFLRKTILTSTILLWTAGQLTERLRLFANTNRRSQDG